MVNIILDITEQGHLAATKTVCVCVHGLSQETEPRVRLHAVNAVVIVVVVDQEFIDAVLLGTFHDFKFLWLLDAHFFRRWLDVNHIDVLVVVDGSE